MIRVIIVDDEILSRIGVSTFLESDKEISVSGMFESAADAISFLETSPVDIVVTDIEMSGINGLDFIKILRERKLARGIIILSCHEDFSYAQTAIENGTDSYLLKHCVAQEKLIEEVKKVYEKTKENKLPDYRPTEGLQKELSENPDHIYQIVVCRLESSGEEKMMESTMLSHLMENLAARMELGTFFSPYDKDMFLLLHFPRDATKKERAERLSRGLDMLGQNVEQYSNRRMLFGIGPLFDSLKEMRSNYEMARAALDGYFYDPSKTVFYYRDKGREIQLDYSFPEFSEANGFVLFRDSFFDLLKTASAACYDVSALKDLITQSLNVLCSQVLKNSPVSESFRSRNQIQPTLFSAVSNAVNVEKVKETVLTFMERFHKELMKEFEENELADAFFYVEKHMTERISLEEAAAVSKMSIPTFSKKIKERTGMTFVEYVNERRVAKAKELLKNRSLSLWDIADATGFSNTNYLLRVFKKQTGMTIGEYRKQQNILN